MRKTRCVGFASGVAGVAFVDAAVCGSLVVGVILASALFVGAEFFFADGFAVARRFSVARDIDCDLDCNSDFGVVFAELARAAFFADSFTSGFAVALEAAFAALFAGFAVGLFAASFVTFTAGLVADCFAALVRAFVMVAPRSLTPGSHAPRAPAPRP
jgi:hypothetical protein